MHSYDRLLAKFGFRLSEDDKVPECISKCAMPKEAENLALQVYELAKQSCQVDGIYFTFRESNLDFNDDIVVANVLMDEPFLNRESFYRFLLDNKLPSGSERFNFSREDQVGTLYSSSEIPGQGYSSYFSAQFFHDRGLSSLLQEKAGDQRKTRPPITDPSRRRELTRRFVWANQ